MALGQPTHSPHSPLLRPPLAPLFLVKGYMARHHLVVSLVPSVARELPTLGTVGVRPASVLPPRAFQLHLIPVAGLANKQTNNHVHYVHHVCRKSMHVQLRLHAVCTLYDMLLSRITVLSVVFPNSIIMLMI